MSSTALSALAGGRRIAMPSTAGSRLSLPKRETPAFRGSYDHVKSWHSTRVDRGSRMKQARSRLFQRGPASRFFFTSLEHTFPNFKSHQLTTSHLPHFVPNILIDFKYRNYDCNSHFPFPQWPRAFWERGLGEACPSE